MPRKLFKNKINKDSVFNFLRHRRNIVSALIVLIAIVYLGIFLYSSVFNTIWFAREGAWEEYLRFNKSGYEETWNDFSSRGVRLEEKVNKEYPDIFR